MLKLSSCSATKVPSSGACGWNTTHSSTFQQEIFCPTFLFFPFASLKIPLIPTPFEIHYVIFQNSCSYQAIGDEAIGLRILLGVRHYDGVRQRIRSGDFFPSSFCALRSPMQYLPSWFSVGSSVSLFTSYYLNGWFRSDLGALWGQRFFSLWIPSLWHIIPRSHKCSWWSHDM